MSDKHQTPSYPLRISAELRSRLEDSARENKRSLNAEISARLEESFLDDLESGELIPASKALEIAKNARTQLQSVIEARAIEAINKAMSAGRTMVAVDFHDLGLDAMTNDELVDVYGDLYTRLDAAGYHLENDGEEVLIVYFSEPAHLKP